MVESGMDVVSLMGSNYRVNFNFWNELKLGPLKGFSGMAEKPQMHLLSGDKKLWRNSLHQKFG